MKITASSPTTKIPIFHALRVMTREELRLFATILLIQESEPGAREVDIETIGGLCGLSEQELLNAIAGLAHTLRLLPVPKAMPDGTLDISLNLLDYQISLEDVQHASIW